VCIFFCLRIFYVSNIYNIGLLIGNTSYFLFLLKAHDTQADFIKKAYNWLEKEKKEFFCYLVLLKIGY